MSLACSDLKVVFALLMTRCEGLMLSWKILQGYNWFQALAFLILVCWTMLLYAKKSFKKMYPVAKNYFGGFIQAHSFSGYVPTFAFSDHVEMKGRSKPLTHPECRSTRSKQQRESTARPNSALVAPFGVARPKGPATPPSQKCSPYCAWAHNGATK